MGHEEDARKVAVAKQKMRRRAKWAAVWGNLAGRPNHWWAWALKPFASIGVLIASVGLFFQWLILDVFLGGGYAKVRPLLLFILVLVGCAWFYDHAAEQGAFAPTNPAVFGNLEIRRACAGTKALQDITAPIDWYRCKTPPVEFSPFRPLVYSLDQMIPLVQLGQKRDWQPIHEVVRLRLWGVGPVILPPLTTQVVTWLQTIGSMVLYLVIAAILGGVIKRD
jgi:hypothetical protein